MDKNKTVTRVKTGLRIALMFGTGSLVSAAVSSVIPKENRSKTQRLTVPLTTFMLGAAATDVAIKQADDIVDSAIKSWTDTTTDLKSEEPSVNN